MRPIPRPTKETITKASSRGLEVIAPIKEPIQVTEEVTMLPTSARIAARVPAVGVVIIPHFKYIRRENLCDMDQISDDPNRNNNKGKTDEIAHRLSHEKTGKLS